MGAAPSLASRSGVASRGRIAAAAWRPFLVYGFFATLLVLGLFLYDDFGISWDEPQQRIIGTVSYNYLVHGSQFLKEFHDRDYGVVLELPLVLLEKGLSLQDSRQVYLMRHLCTFLIFFAGVWFFFRLASGYLRGWTWGLLAALWLVLSPRIFADAFYNSKDLPFLSVFIISIYTLRRFLVRPTWQTACWHGLVCAVLINLRILGILLPCFTGFFLLLQLLTTPGDKSRYRQAAVLLVVYGVVLALVLYATWPYLWENPVGNFRQAYSNMRKFRWPGTMLYRGEFIKAMEVPWHYLPTWIIITTPPLYLAAFVSGLLTVAWHWLKAPLQRFFSPLFRDDLLMLAWFFGPLLAIIVLQAVVYDTWRHVFFIYPAFLLLGLRGVQQFWRSTRLLRSRGLQYAGRAILAGMLLFGTGSVVSFMTEVHPYHNLYFNRLSGHSLGSIREHYELDFWGLTYREGLEYILANDKRSRINVKAANGPGFYNAQLLPPAERERLVFVEEREFADYFVTAYRWHPEAYPEYTHKVYARKIKGAEAMAVYKVD